MKVESTRVSIDDLNDKIRRVKASDKIKDSVNGLNSWNKGVSDLMSTWEDDNFQFDKLFKDLNEIEKINDRMEKDIEAKVSLRISKFGKEGDKILGIDIPVAYMSPRDLPPLPSLAPNMQQNFSYTDRSVRRAQPEIPQNDRSMFMTEPVQ